MGHDPCPPTLVSMPRTYAVFDGLALLLGDGMAGVVGAMGPEKSAALDAAVAPHLEAAARAQVEGILRALHTEVDSSKLQEAGGHFLAAVGSDRGWLRELVVTMGAGELLSSVVRRHPQSKGVQDNAQWALLRLLGHQPLVSVLRDPELGASPQAVKAALWSVSHSGHQLSAEGTMSLEERRDLATLATAAMARFGDNMDVTAHGLSVIGSVLRAQVPDAVQGDATALIPVVLQAMQRFPYNSHIHMNAARALANLVDGNAEAASLLRTSGPGVTRLLDQSMAAHPYSESLADLCTVHYAVQGAAGLLEALDRELLNGPQQQAAVLQAFGKHAEECDVETLVKLDAVGRVVAAMQTSPGAAPAGISALGRIVEFFLQHAASPRNQEGPEHRAAIERGVDTIVKRLQIEITASKPDVYVYAEALEALGNVSRRSGHLAARISACDTLTAAVDLVFERDYFSLPFESLSQLLGAISFFSGLPRLQAMLEKYPEAPVFHEAACAVLVDLAEHEDGSDSPGSVMGVAPSIAYYATKVLMALVPLAPNAEALATRAVKLLGHVLGAVAPGTWLPVHQEQRMLKQQEQEGQEGPQQQASRPSKPEGPVLEDGLSSLLELLRQFPASSQVASEVCCTLVRVTATSSSSVLPILGSFHAGDLLLAVVRRFPDNVAVMRDAAVALGVLGGVQWVLDLLCAAPGSYVVQLAGCRALTEVCRMGVEFPSPEVHNAAVEAVRRAQGFFASQQSWQLQAEAEVALGYIMPAAPRAPTVGSP